MKKMWTVSILVMIVTAGCAEQKRDRVLPTAKTPGSEVETKVNKEAMQRAALEACKSIKETDKNKECVEKHIKEAQVKAAAAKAQAEEAQMLEQAKKDCASKPDAEKEKCIVARIEELKKSATTPAETEDGDTPQATTTSTTIPSLDGPGVDPSNPVTETQTTPLNSETKQGVATKTPGSLEVKLATVAFNESNSAEVSDGGDAIGVYTGEGSNANVGELTKLTSSIKCVNDGLAIKDLLIPRIGQLSGQLENSDEVVINRITLLEGSKLSFVTKTANGEFNYLQRTCDPREESLLVPQNQLLSDTTVIELNVEKPVAYAVQATLLLHKDAGQPYKKSETNPVTGVVSKTDSYTGLRLLNVGCNVHSMAQKLEGRPVHFRLEEGSQVIFHVKEGDKVRATLIKCAVEPRDEAESNEAGDEDSAGQGQVETQSSTQNSAAASRPSAQKSNVASNTVANKPAAPAPAAPPKKAVDVLNVNQGATESESLAGISSKCAKGAVNRECVEASMMP